MTRIELLIVLAIATILAAVAYDAYEDSHKTKFQLAVSDWSCTKEHTDTMTTFIHVGNMLVPQTYSSVVCDQWSRKP